MGLFIGAGVMSGAFSGLLSYGISFMDGNAGMMGWSWIFVRPTGTSIVKRGTNSKQIIEGCATVAVGILASFGTCDFDFFLSSGLTTPTLSDGGLPLHRQVLDPWRERFREL